MIIGYCILIHPGICILWCRTTMRSVRLVSYAFLYTTDAHQQGRTFPWERFWSKGEIVQNEEVANTFTLGFFG